MSTMRRAVWLLALFLLTSVSASAQQTTGTIVGRVLDDQGAAIPGATVIATSASTGFTREAISDAEGVYRLSALPVGRYDMTVELVGFTKIDRKDVIVNVGQTITLDFSLKVASVAETVIVTAQTPLIEATVVVGRRRGRHRPHREHSAERPPVRQPRRDAARRRPRLPLRPDQEHAVLAADQRRQRPQRELPDRRRRQQRRHRRRPAAAVPARSDPGVQLRHLALQGRVRPQQRRRDEHRHQERHQQPARQLLRVVPRQVDERQDRHREEQQRRQAGLPPQPVRRQLRRPDHPGQAALLRRGGADAAGHLPGRSPPRACSPTLDGIYATPYRETLLNVKATANLNADQLPVGALRPQPELAALRRRATTARRATGATARTSSTRSTSTTTG